MPHKIYDKKAEKDVAQYESIEDKNEKLGERIMALEKERRNWLISGKGSDESDEAFANKLFDNIKLLVKLMNRYQKLEGKQENWMSKPELAKFFVENGEVQLAKKSGFNMETAKEAYAPVTAKLKIRGYWPAVAGNVDYSGVSTSWEVPIKLEQRGVNTLRLKFDDVSDSMDRATGSAEGGSTNPGNVTHATIFTSVGE